MAVLFALGIHLGLQLIQVFVCGLEPSHASPVFAEDVLLFAQTVRRVSDSERLGVLTAVFV